VTIDHLDAAAEALAGVIVDVSDPQQVVAGLLAVAARISTQASHGECEERRAAFVEVAGRSWDLALRRQRGRLS